MSSGDPDIAYYYGDTVTMNCDLGAAFAVDYSKDMPNRISNTSVIVCDDDFVSVEGVWTSAGNCTGILLFKLMSHWYILSILHVSNPGNSDKIMF